MDFKIETKGSFKIIGYKCKGEWKDWVYFNECYDNQLRNNDLKKSYYKEPFWQVGAYGINTSEEYEFDELNHEYQCIIGAELSDEQILRGMEVIEIPSSTWAVFEVEYDPLNDATGQIYAKVLSEWFPVSSYIRNDNIPYLEVFSIPGEARVDNYKCEVWVPVIKKSDY